MSSIVGEKLSQAVGILDEHDIDAWLTFVRETEDGGDPVLPLILGQNLTWQSALLVTRTGDRHAIVGKYDDEAVRSQGVWTSVEPYVEGIREPLLAKLRCIDPQRIAINYSRDDVKADGLSHGLYLLLLDYLEGTPWKQRLVSADGIIDALRGRKTTGEIERMELAWETTNEIFSAVAATARPGIAEAEISRFMHGEASLCGVGLAWDAAGCPIVTTGPDSMVGHGHPSEELSITEGNVFHLDFGVRRDGYCSDIQRCWYVPRDGEEKPPEPVQRAFDTVRSALEAAAAKLCPGVECWEVDAAARQVVVDAGYPEYQHATGHHVGRRTHDGGGILGPRWERYGRTPYRRVEPGNVFALELGVNIDGCGYLGLEEMVVVTSNGCRELSCPQTELPLLGR